MERKNILLKRWEEHRAGIKGKSNNSSTSKIKNITATKKNRIEKGRRAVYFGVNPHSKGLNFSRSNLVFILVNKPKNNNRDLIKRTRIILIINIIINFFINELLVEL